MAGKKDLDVLHPEAQLLHTDLEQRHSTLEIAVDEDMSLGRRDQVFGQIGCTDIVHIPDDAMGLQRRVPVVWIFPRSLSLEQTCHTQDAKQTEHHGSTSRLKLVRWTPWQVLTS
jgi:hypothetical protein